jgi:hypothetical protein
MARTVKRVVPVRGIAPMRRRNVVPTPIGPRRRTIAPPPPTPVPMGGGPPGMRKGGKLKKKK